MTSSDFTSLLIVLVTALGAALLATAVRRLLVPLVVVEILLGVAIGPEALGVARATPSVGVLAGLGVCLLFFLAGFEIRLERILGWPATLAILAWLASLVLAAAASLAMAHLGLIAAWAGVALALTTTALGVLVPTLRESDLVETPLGVAVLAVGAVAWVGPLLLLPLLVSPEPVASLVLRALLFGCAIALAGAAVILSRAKRWSRSVASLDRPTSQVMVRGALVVLLGSTALALLLHVSLLLGAFSAGILLRSALDADVVDRLRTGLDPIAFGLFIPVFFVTTGMRLDLGVFATWHGVLLVLLLLGCFLLVRGGPAVFYRRRLGSRQAASLGFFAATKLPLLVVIVSAARGAGRMDAATGSVLIAAAMISVIVFPAAARRLSLPSAGRIGDAGLGGQGRDP
jgi:Kef-type K+ transport system membrane component KefB